MVVVAGLTGEQKMDDKAFNEFLEHADQVVRSWPLWKQTLLGGTGKREEPREPMDNFKQVADCLRSENRQLKAANEGLRKEVAGLYLAKSGQMAEIESLQRELRQVVNERDSARSNLQHLETSYGKLSAEHWNVKAQSDEFFKKIHELNGRLEAVARIAESGWQE